LQFAQGAQGPSLLRPLLDRVQIPHFLAQCEEEEGEMRRATRLDKSGKLAISERAFQAQIMSAAKLQGWLTYHSRPGLTQRGRWVTPMSGDKGWPDVCMTKNGRIWFVEIKSESGKLAPAQETWLRRLAMAPSPWVRCWVLRPSMFDDFWEAMKKI
jgi:hypothetical protein